MVISTSFDRETIFCPTAMDMLNFVPSANFTYLKGHDVEGLARSAFGILRDMTIPSNANVTCHFCPIFPDFELLAQEIWAQFNGNPGSDSIPPCPPRSSAAFLLASDRRELLRSVLYVAKGVHCFAMTSRSGSRHLAPLLADLRRISHTATPRIPAWVFDSTIVPLVPTVSSTRSPVHPAITRMFSNILHGWGDSQPLQVDWRLVFCNGMTLA